MPRNAQAAVRKVPFSSVTDTKINFFLPTPRCLKASEALCCQCSVAAIFFPVSVSSKHHFAVGPMRLLSSKPKPPDLVSVFEILCINSTAIDFGPRIHRLPDTVFLLVTFFSVCHLQHVSYHDDIPWIFEQQLTQTWVFHELLNSSKVRPGMREL